MILGIICIVCITAAVPDPFPKMNVAQEASCTIAEGYTGLMFLAKANHSTIYNRERHASQDFPAPKNCVLSQAITSLQIPQTAWPESPTGMGMKFLDPSIELPPLPRLAGQFQPGSWDLGLFVSTQAPSLNGFDAQAVDLHDSNMLSWKFERWNTTPAKAQRPKAPKIAEIRYQLTVPFQGCSTRVSIAKSHHRAMRINLYIYLIYTGL